MDKYRESDWSMVQNEVFQDFDPSLSEGDFKRFCNDFKISFRAWLKGNFRNGNQIGSDDAVLQEAKVWKYLTYDISLPTAH